MEREIGVAGHRYSEGPGRMDYDDALWNSSSSAVKGSSPAPNWSVCSRCRRRVRNDDGEDLTTGETAAVQQPEVDVDVVVRIIVKRNEWYENNRVCMRRGKL